MAVDTNEERISDVLPYVTNAQIGDSTNAEFLRSLGIGNFDVCIVTISGSFQNSLETTSLLKEINRTLGITIVVITHEMSVIEEICDRVAIIDHSQIAEVGEVSDIFMNPKTEIAKRLLYASGRLGEEVLGERCLRIIFDGTQTSSPVICDMVLECGAPVNILFADTKTIEGKMHGYTLIQLPENRELGDKMKKYLDLHGVQYLEEAYHV